MSIMKYANSQFSFNEIHSASAISESLSTLLTDPKNADIDNETKQRFIKFAEQLNKIAPRSKDFLYFSCIMLHSAESSLIDRKTGEVKKDKNGNSVTAEWIVDKNGSWKWKCSDPNLHPLKNGNNDIFPEVELKKAYRKWIGKPLCKDHQSSSVDGIRGIIVDTYYDDKYKRVIGLCALDMVNYPDLARKVKTGYAHDVSMGVAVGISICYKCGNIAKVESDYCQCCKDKSTYGEININLSPIELSLVVTGADPEAKLKNIIASLNKYSEQKNDRIQHLKSNGCITPNELDRLEDEVNDIRITIQSIMEKRASVEKGEDVELRNLAELLKNPEVKKDQELYYKILKRMKSIADVEEPEKIEQSSPTESSFEMNDTGKGYTGQAHDSGPPPWAMEGNRLASQNLETQIVDINNKLGAMELALRDMAKGVEEATKYKEDQSMSGEKLRERAAARRAMFKNAYHQGGGGVNDPATLPYPVDPMNEKLRTDGDKQMEGQGMETGSEGMHPGYESYGNEEALKKKLLRAELEERKNVRHAFMKSAEEAQEIETKKTPSGNIVVTKDGKAYQLNEDGTYNEIDDAQIQAARDLLDAVGCGSSKKTKTKKEAYWQGGGGVNEPQTYPVDPLNEKLRTDGDKQMEGQGMESGSDGMHPGYESYGNEEALKKKLLRAKLRAKFVIAYKNEDKTIVDKKNSRWEIYAGPEKILEATGSEIYEDELEENWENLASKNWGRKVLSTIREEGLNRVAWLLKGEELIKTAQPPMPPMPPMPGQGGPAGLPELPPVEDEGKEEEPKDKDEDPVKSALTSATEHLEEVEKALGDIEKTYDEKAGEKSKGTDLDTSGISEADDSFTEVTSQFNELFASLDENADELAMLAESLEGRVNSGQSVSDPITSELVRLTSEAVEASEDFCKQASLFVTEAKKKKEKKEEEKEEKKSKKKGKEEDEEEEVKKPKKKGKEKEEDEDEEVKKPKKKGKEKEEDEDEEDEEKEEKKSKKSKAELLVEELLKARASNRRNIAKKAMDENVNKDELKKMVEEILNEKLGPLGGLDKFVEEENSEEEHGPEELVLDIEEGDVGKDVDMDALDSELSQMLDDFVADDAIETQASARRAWREKVAADVGSKYQLSLDGQTTLDTDMPVGKSQQLGQLSTKTPEATVEGIAEIHEEILKQINSLPKVRMAMDHLFNMLKTGKLALSELDNQEKLKSLAVDAEAAKYLKSYFGEGDQQSSQFGTELTKEYSQKKVSASLEVEKIKMRRAYDMALEMQEKGLISDDVPSLHAQVDEIMNFDDKAFESYKRALSRVTKRVKTASSPAINVGINEDQVGNSVSTVNMTDELHKIFS